MMNNDFDQLPDVDEPIIEAKAADIELQNMQNEATARPKWDYAEPYYPHEDDDYEPGIIYIDTTDGGAPDIDQIIAYMNEELGTAVLVKHAELIVTAVNAHDSLVVALERLTTNLESRVCCPTCYQYRSKNVLAPDDVGCLDNCDTKLARAALRLAKERVG